MPETLRIISPAEAGRTLAAAVQEIDEVDPARLRELLLSPTDQAAAAIIVLAWLACGRAARVRTLLRELPAAPPAGPDAGSGGSAERAGGALLPLLLGRYVAWTGDLRTAAAAWPAIRLADATGAEPPEQHPASPDAAATAGSPGVPAADAALVMAAGTVAGLKRTATDLGDARFAASVDARARTLSERVRERSPTGRAALLACALDLFVPPVWPHEDTGTAEPGQPLPVAAAEEVLRIAHVLLGAAPDAARHRLWLRPRPPGAPDVPAILEAQSIVTGEDSVSAAVEWDGDGVIARVRQDAGPIPLTLLLELTLPRPLRRALVDGQDAELTPRPAAAGQVVAVQLVLDHERSVELVM